MLQDKHAHTDTDTVTDTSTAHITIDRTTTTDINDESDIHILYTISIPLLPLAPMLKYDVT